jgi:transcriptional regulator with XRE-family HTH domain
LLDGIDSALLSGPIWSAEEWVAEDWAAVSRAIQERLAELGITQTELEQRSGVSKGTVGELVRNNKQRERRNPSTLGSVSVGLGWKRSHLADVRDGIEPPLSDEPEVVFENDIPGRLRAVEDNVRKMAAQLAELVDSMNKERRLDEISAEFEAKIRRLFVEFLPPNDQ